MSNTKFILYTVQNSKGQWYRSKGYGGHGDSWIDNFDGAKIYGKIGPARRVVGYFANNWPTFPTPNIVELSIDNMTVIDESVRVAKQKLAKKKAEKNRELHRLATNLKRAQEDFEVAKRRLNDVQQDEPVQVDWKNRI